MEVQLESSTAHLQFTQSQLDKTKAKVNSLQKRLDEKEAELRDIRALASSDQGIAELERVHLTHGMASVAKVVVDDRVREFGACLEDAKPVMIEDRVSVAIGSLPDGRVRALPRPHPDPKRTVSNPSFAIFWWLFDVPLNIGLRVIMLLQIRTKTGLRKVRPRVPLRNSPTDSIRDKSPFNGCWNT